MRRIAVSAALCCIFLLVACTKGEGVPLRDVSASLQNKLDFPALTAVRPEALRGYLPLPEEDLGDFVFFVSAADDVADEFGIIEITSEEAFSSAIGVIRARISARASSFAALSSVESAKCASAAVYRLQSLLVYVVCSDNASASALLLKMGAKPAS